MVLFLAFVPGGWGHCPIKFSLSSTMPPLSYPAEEILDCYKEWPDDVVELHVMAR